MEKTTTELTIEYIKERPDIKNCLKKGLINYSSLARLIAKDLKIEKKTSKEAILIAARRFQEKLKKEISYEKKIKDLMANSEMEIKNKVAVFILEKNINLDYIDDIHKEIRKSSGTFYIFEGSDNYTVVMQSKFSSLIKNKLKSNIIKQEEDLAIINFISPKNIEHIPGVLSFLTSLFAENNVNIVEFFSCWTDTLFVIKIDDLNKAIEFLNF
jgi:aspartokinase